MNLGLNSFTKFDMTIALEHPIAQMIQVTSFIMEGVLDRFPKLRVGFLEAGTGWVPYMMDRLDRTYEVMARNGRREYSDYLQRKPSEHFASGRLYFSCEGGEPGLKDLIGRIGHKGLIFASDFPHEANVEHALHELHELMDRDDLSDAAKRGIFCDNTEAFYAR
jgi:predicted TIM-barrel fold metal-dependent hydrolase